jgi:RNA-directed DNA polymerase
MDDILILAPTRWQLRGAVKMVNQAACGARSGETSGQDIYWQDRTRLRLPFSPAGLTLAKKTIANFIEKASRLYEQKRRAVSAAMALERRSAGPLPRIDRGHP